MGGGIEILGLVHKKESLERGVRPFAASNAGIAAWSIEDGHLGRGEAAFPEGVNTATLGIGAGGGFKLVGEGAGESDHFPKSGRLRSFDAASPHLGV